MFNGGCHHCRVDDYFQKSPTVPVAKRLRAPPKGKISEDIEIIEVALLHILLSFQNATFGFF